MRINESYLVRSSGWDKDGIAKALHNFVTLNCIFLVEAVTQRAVKIPALVVDRVVVWLQSGSTLYSHFVKQVSDFVCVSGIVNMP